MPLPPGYRDRFPGVAGDWARFDGPAGTQMVDVAIDATAAFSRSGSNANSHGFFDAARAVDELMARARTTVAALIGADPGGVVFGPSTTNVLFGLTRAIGRGLRAGDEIVVTQGGAVRAGVSSYNTRDDVDRLLASVRPLAQS